MGRPITLAGKKNLTGNGEDNILNGSGGYHRILGGGGSDQIIGSAGSDVIRAGGGDDFIFGGDGDDFIFGNGGTDTLLISDLSSMSISAGKGNSWIVESSDGTDTIKHIELISDGTYTYAVGQNNGVFGLASEASTDEDTAVTLDLMAGAFDVEGDSFSVSALDATSASGATITLNPDGTVNYDPGALFQSLAQGTQATDSFSYSVTDAAGNITTQTMTVTINGLNDAPEFTGGDTTGGIVLPQSGGEASVSGATILRNNVVDNTNGTANLDVAVLNNGTKVVIANQSAYANNGGRTTISLVDAAGIETEIFEDTQNGLGQTVVALEGGGFAVAYVSAGIHVRSFDADGNQVSYQTLPEAYSYNRVNLTATSDGGYAVSWVTYDGEYEDYMATFDAAGGLVSGPLDLNTGPSYSAGNAITELADGGFAMVAGHGSAVNPLELILLDQSGAILSQTTVTAGEGGSAGQDSSIIQLANGSIVVPYGLSSAASDLVFEIFDAQGNQVLEHTWVSDFALNQHGTYERISDAVALPDGGFAIAYENTYTRTDPATGELRDPGIYLRTFNADGTRSSEEIYVGQGRNTGLDVDADGNLVVVAIGVTGNPTVWTVTPPSSGPDLSGVLSDSGILTAEDVDLGAALSFEFAGGADYGTVDVNAGTGEWVYTLDPNSSVIADGATFDSFEVSVTDEFGAIDLQTVTIDIA